MFVPLNPDPWISPTSVNEVTIQLVNNLDGKPISPELNWYRCNLVLLGPRLEEAIQLYIEAFRGGNPTAEYLLHVQRFDIFSYYQNSLLKAWYGATMTFWIPCIGQPSAPQESLDERTWR